MRHYARDKFRWWVRSIRNGIRRHPILSVLVALAYLVSIVALSSGCNPSDDIDPADCATLAQRYATQTQEALDFARQRSGLEPTVVDSADRQGWLDWVRAPENEDVPGRDLAEDVATDLIIGYEVDERQAFSAGLRIVGAARDVDNCLDSAS